MSEYPKRPSHFAHNYCRLLAKACAANDITALGCWLCTVIVHLEDSRRYTGPISFYNEQLAPLLGIRKWETLEKARRLAMDHGWLAYECGGRHKPGYYWVTIPAGLEGMDDAPCDESRYPKNGDLEGDQDESRYPKNGISADTTVEQHGGSFIPNPNPSPNKNTCASAGERPSRQEEPTFRATETAKKGAGQTNGDSAAFKVWWEHYPRKTGRKAAAKAYASAVKEISAEHRIAPTEAQERLLEAARVFAASDKGRGAFVPYPTTWLNQGRYDDDPRTWTESKNGKPVQQDSLARIR
ncbi:MAG: hypothetical protein ACOX1P_17345 [Thermoguttaceae bacterium]